MRYYLFFIFSFLFIFQSWCQSDFSLFKYRHVGPIRGGRVTAVTGVPSEPSTFYMGASGGKDSFPEYDSKSSLVSIGEFNINYFLALLALSTA